MNLLGVAVGSTIGGLVPSLFGAGAFSGWAVVWSGIGGVAGLILARRYGA